MVTIRIPLPQEPLRPTPSGRFTAPGVEPVRDATGAQMARLGQGLQQAGYEASRAADFLQDQADAEQKERDRLAGIQQDRRDDAMVKEAHNLTEDAIRRLLHDPQAGYLNTVGRAAGDSRKQFNEALDKEVRRVGETLEPGVQREQWQGMAAHGRLRAMAQADVHESQQTRVHLMGATKARQDTFRIAGDKERMLGESDELSRLHGEDEVQRDMRRLVATTEFHEQRIRLLAPQDPQGAAQMLKDAGQEIHPTVRAELESFVARATKNKSVADTSTRFSMDAVAEAAKQGGTLDEQEEHAMQIADFTFRGGKLTAEERDQSQQRIETHYKRRRNLEAGADNGLVQQATSALLADPMASPADLPNDLRTSLEQRGLMGEVNAFQNSNKRYVTRPKTYAEVVSLTAQQLRSMTPAELERKYRGGLDDRDLNMLRAAHRQAHGATQKNEGKALSQRDRIVEGFYTATSRSRAKALGDDGERELYAWKNRVQTLLDAEGEEVDDKRLQEIIDQVAMDRVVVDRSWPFANQEKPSAVLSDEERRGAFVQIGDEQVPLGAVPAEVQRQIEADLRAEGITPTEKRIVQEWVRANRPQTRAALYPAGGR